jgi:hypothetical protein
MPEDYALSLEEIKRMMANAMGTNLAGQSMAGPVATGQAYAQQIAGGMPMEQVIAPGVSYSPEMAGGYTQKDLDMIAAGPAPVMPIPPTTDEVATIEDQMPYAPPGVQEPTPYIPGQTPFPGIPDFLRDLDFSFLENLDFSNLPGAQEPSEPQFGSSAPAGFIPPPSGSFNTMAFVDYYNPTTGETWSAPSGGWTAPEGWIVGRPDGGLKLTFDESTSNSSEPSPQQDFFKVDQNLFNFEEIADKIDMDEVAKIDIEKIDIPESVSLFSDILKEPALGEPVSKAPTLPSIFDQPTAPVIPAQPLPQNIFANIPKPQQIPVIPNIPVMPQPIVPQPIPPMNLTRLSNLPVSNFVQPSVEEIVSPIRIGRTLPQTPRGLFSL